MSHLSSNALNQIGWKGEKRAKPVFMLKLAGQNSASGAVNRENSTRGD
jgi:hypothetical protein